MRRKKVRTAFSAKKIASRIKALAKELRKDAGKDEVFLLGILKGTTCFLADLMRAIPGPCSYGYIDVVRDVSDTEIATALEIDFLSHNNALQGRRVYVLKDVVMTGVIENYLLTQLRQRAPRTLKLVALLDRPEGRRVDLSVDFRAFTVKEGSYVGYGLDLDEGYSNLPYIGRL